jgi:hypothetical protein
MKSRRMRWVEHVALTGELRNYDKILIGKTEGRDHFVETGVDAKIILKWNYIQLPQDRA